MAQNIVVALLVAGCIVYALWTLAPKVSRSRLAVALLKLPLPLRLQKPLVLAVQRRGGCACDGCGQSSTTTLASVHAKVGGTSGPEYKPVVFVRGSYSGKAQN